MSDKQVTIYHARTAQDAQVLKNVLAEAGIRALVTNEVLADGAGTDILGWPSLAQVGGRRRRRVGGSTHRRGVRSAREPRRSRIAGRACNRRAGGVRMAHLSPVQGAANDIVYRVRHLGHPFPTPGDRMPEEMAEAESASAMTCICPTCDEPFVPRFLSVCEWCGHQFEDGPSDTAGLSAPAEEMNHRVTMTLWALIAFIVVVVAYFVLMWR